MKAGMFVFAVGLIVTFGAVGGVENSANDSQLLDAIIVAATGLAVMFAGTKMLKRANRG